jgi:hypothetical protein
MPRRPSDPDLKAEFSARIKEVLTRLKAREVAIALGVKTQTVYNYRDGRNAPSPEVIRRAMETWPSFSLSYRGKALTLHDFHKRPVLSAKKAVQYELWDAIKKLDSESVQIKILKKETASVQLGVRIYFRNR